eukprot:4175270-Pyramimonas_sp.AAC.1
MAWGDAAGGHQKSVSWADERGSNKRGGSKGPHRKWQCQLCGCKKNGWSSWYCVHCHVAWNEPVAEEEGMLAADVPPRS